MILILADDDSDANPHDFDGTDLEYGSTYSSHLNIGQHSFSQMQVNNNTKLIIAISKWRCDN